jgi:curved DNA-binding protein CbpA
MSRQEALRVLGLSQGASPEQVRAAHRQLIKKLHPDQGGSSFLAQQVNDAKQVLLER